MKIRKWLDLATPDQMNKLTQELSIHNDGGYDEFIDTVFNLMKVRNQQSS